ncbi:hypothetical protein A3C09_03750 [Candidatus Uhrbacteria bacterium RIFCSPHIGHO2_02_FULL_47_44]|uniref:t-SNARE coiled-coil homology domain-containing protein n=1 Tax=Candidatus Uhrbacteria bacterium RIFCSPLOWO2_02_FULL_48_18 TaxID=1802408 RepID=A0A1F7VCN1_9BACT|nr:MAG: hypothetical protein A2839_00765 [Candidatus Uhrbacteria bacterium RIFCSPHIGHO2_01_FULL_47_10]OGL71793.1 MAG: hypothetical protein A3C09_03750 [Candidatus Uhrbacteria bacterium RIFCSPHIGHO2_02_FULL_47_44]OGL77815.1 MAG: hypothetical protein A3E97_02540 [Candidatus Uhrbacteria bacterium RIFCSPHIGHO2_12_FULL_47_12]OGL80634.1 MAG: hypothetical protein A3B20_04535 [Candidatus Uhrbacteria bacterium RIFCSPLOWO2_01_FULL_47_17]OGL88183.1 MAG: hypothetical protein A3I41_00445 [Candidatus Uhrbact
MDNILNTKLDRLEQTNVQILDVLQSMKTEMTGMKSEITGIKSEMTDFRSEFNDFRSETNEQFSEIQERFEFMVETAVTKTEFDQTIHDIRCEMATKDQFIHFTDRLDAKFLDLKHDIIAGIRASDKKFLKFAI